MTALLVAPIPDANGVVYRAGLPQGTIQSGAFQFSTSGSPDVGSTNLEIHAGSDITVTNAPPPGTRISIIEPLTVKWSGGDANSVVSVTVTSHRSFVDYSVIYTSLATDHMVIIGFYVTRTPSGGIQGLGLGVPSANSADITVDVEPLPTLITRVNAPGLTLGGEARWRYRHVFTGYSLSQEPSSAP